MSVNSKNQMKRLDSAELRRRLAFSDRHLLSECRVEAYKASGPGGQHRNKVTSAIRLRHQPSGLSVIAEESRSQHENRTRALRRLRESIALTFRLPRPAEPQWPAGVQVRDGRLRVNESNPAYPQVIALVLDALAPHDGEPKPAAQRLGLTTSSLIRFAYAHPQVWREVQGMRRVAGLPPLRCPK
jgi:hypothetical protein